ncbi:MAG: hypothetical protein H7318_17510 [Oligoflexus sp.]|nr:hypothetical protein [Oligoflexus sp.]
MNYMTLVLLSVLGLTACSEAPPEKLERSLAKSENYTSTTASTNTEEQKPSPSEPTTIPAIVVSPVVNPSIDGKTVSEADMIQFLAMAAFQVDGLPNDKSDFYSFELKIKADALITHFSYKIATPADCKVASGYKVEPIATVVKINVDQLPDGPVSVCILRFLAAAKMWQKTENATAYTWQKIPFIRSIKSQFVEYDRSCLKNIITKAEVNFSGGKGSYTWVRDPRSQGCSSPKESGVDNLTITFSDSNEIKGFWAYNGEEASGWYAFKWKTKERTSFDGVYGYGDPGLSPVGPWSSLAP